MVTINSRAQQHEKYSLDKKKQLIAAAALLLLIYWFNYFSSDSDEEEAKKLRGERVNRPNRPASISVVLDEEPFKNIHPKSIKCAYKSLKDLAEEEWKPQKGKRHMITPPVGGKISLVCCGTTAGPLSIAVHQKWAPLGAKRFMDMVTSGYFDSLVPFMRCVKGFLCQFGLNADVSKSKEFRKSIEVRYVSKRFQNLYDSTFFNLIQLNALRMIEIGYQKGQSFGKTRKV